MEIKGVAGAVQKAAKEKDVPLTTIGLAEKITGKDLPDEKIKEAAKKVVNKENVEKVKDKIEDVVEKIKK